MKRYLYLICMMVSSVILSCGKEKSTAQVDDLAQVVTLTMNIKDDSPQNRTSATGVSRYIVEVYEGATATGAPIQRVEQATSRLEVMLRADKQYTFLFWADYGTPGAAEGVNQYDARDLKAAKVTVKQIVDNTQAYCNTPTAPAFCGTKSFTFGSESEADYSVTLTHAVAQVNFIHKKALEATANSMKSVFKGFYSLNVADNSVTKLRDAGDYSDMEAHYELTDIPAVAAGKIFGTTYVMASNDAANKTMLDMVVNFAEREIQASELTLGNVPFSKDHKTNIKGNFNDIYDSEVTIICNDWTTPDNDKPLPVPVMPVIGDYYFGDGDYSSVSTAFPNLVGAVFYVAPNGKTGKIVSTKETGTIYASTYNVASAGTKSVDDGAANTQGIKNLSDYGDGSQYPAVKWCLGVTDGGLSWYIPAVNELLAVYNNKSRFPDLTAFGWPWNSGYYWSSTNEDMTDMRAINFTTGANDQKNYLNESFRVRPVAAVTFKLRYQ